MTAPGPLERAVVDEPGSAKVAAEELVRCALLAKLALDLGDAGLVRRAALVAASQGRLLAGMGGLGEDDVRLPALGGLLRLRYPSVVLAAAGLRLPVDEDLDGDDEDLDDDELEPAAAVLTAIDGEGAA